jgi:hypothetical protein
MLIENWGSPLDRTVQRGNTNIIKAVLKWDKQLNYLRMGFSLSSELNLSSKTLSVDLLNSGSRATENQDHNHIQMIGMRARAVGQQKIGITKLIGMRARAVGQQKKITITLN